MKSTMKAVLAVLMTIAALTGVSTDILGECDMAVFYQELGCTAKFSSSDQPCPDQFICPNLHPDPTKCYYKGKAYADKEPIPQDRVANPCSQACICSVYNNEPQFLCAAVDCYDTFDDDLNEQCISTYELDSCCNTDKVCGKDAIAGLKSCVVDGKTYLEGQMFEPQNTQLTCICTAEWDGSVENKTYCRNIDCGQELYYQNNIMDNCAPVFAKSMRSCPIGFECGSTSSKVIKGLNLKGLTGECRFGNLTLSIGDEVTVEEKCMKCNCSVPPFVNCLKMTCD